MYDNSRWIIGGAAIGAMLGGLAGWYIYRRQYGEENLPDAVAEVDKSRLMRVIWAMVGVVRLIFEMDKTG